MIEAAALVVVGMAGVYLVALGLTCLAALALGAEVLIAVLGPVAR
jgi:hypothetical protein